MSALDELAAGQDGKLDPTTAAAQLTAIFDLASVDVSVTGARVVGRGGSASCDLFLSDGSALTFEAVRDLANVTKLKIELAACTGATPKLTPAQAIQAVALVRALADHHRVVTADELAVEWGATFLQAADVLDVDLSDQAQRWEAFRRLEGIDPAARWRQDGISIAKASIVLRDTDQVRLVRTGWFRGYVRADDHTVSPQEIANRMERVGWKRPGVLGRIKATRPGLRGELAWSFYQVPAGWENPE